MTTITNAYVKSKQKSKYRRYEEGLTTARMVQAEETEKREQQAQLFAPVPRPDDGPRCACGKRLYSYEIPLKKCLRCKKIAIQQAKNWTPAGEKGLQNERIG